jgi:uncharacterized membrane protein YhaH (DUF805 family)
MDSGVHWNGGVGDLGATIRTVATGSVGCTGRREYWQFLLIHVIISLVLGVAGTQSTPIIIVYFLYILVLLIPSLAVGARRLHDTGRSGWTQLFGLIPLVGWIIVLIFMAEPGKEDNKYGPSLS